MKRTAVSQDAAVWRCMISLARLAVYSELRVCGVACPSSSLGDQRLPRATAAGRGRLPHSLARGAGTPLVQRGGPKGIPTSTSVNYTTLCWNIIYATRVKIFADDALCVYL